MVFELVDYTKGTLRSFIENSDSELFSLIVRSCGICNKRWGKHSINLAVDPLLNSQLRAKFLAVSDYLPDKISFVAANQWQL